MEIYFLKRDFIKYNKLNAGAREKEHPVFNVGMCDENDHHLTYFYSGCIAMNLKSSTCQVGRLASAANEHQ